MTPILSSRPPRPNSRLVAILTSMALALTGATWADDQPPLPPGARVRLQPLNFYAGDQMSLRFLPDGKSLIWAKQDYTIYRWDLATARETGQFTGDDWWSQDRFQEFSILQAIDHHTILHTAAHGLAVLDLETGQEQVVSEAARGKPSWASPDGKRLVTYSQHGSWSRRTATATFTLWDLAQSVKIREFTHSFRDAPAKVDAGARLMAVAFAPDGQTIASSWIYIASGPMLTYRVGQIVSLWDVASGEERQLDAEAASHLHFLDEGQTLACADGRNAGAARSGEDQKHGLMEVWDVASGRKRRRFESSADWAGPVVFSPDGKLFASSGCLDDNAVYVWSTATGQQVHQLAGHSGGVLSLTFSLDGSLLASGSQDSILIWEMAAHR